MTQLSPPLFAFRGPVPTGSNNGNEVKSGTLGGHIEVLY